MRMSFVAQPWEPAGHYVDEQDDQAQHAHQDRRKEQYVDGGTQRLADLFASLEDGVSLDHQYLSLHRLTTQCPSRFMQSVITKRSDPTANMALNSAEPRGASPRATWTI